MMHCITMPGIPRSVSFAGEAQYVAPISCMVPFGYAMPAARRALSGHFLCQSVCAPVSTFKGEFV